MGSPQTLSEADRRQVAGWAADCAQRVLGVFETRVPGDDRPRRLIARARAFARGELDTAAEIRRRFAGGVGANEVRIPAAAAAARAAGQAAAVCHMGAHGLGTAAYAARSAGLASSDRPDAVEEEIRWSSRACRPRSARPCEASLPSGSTSPARSARACSPRADSA